MGYQIQLNIARCVWIGVHSNVCFVFQVWASGPGDAWEPCRARRSLTERGTLASGPNSSAFRYKFYHRRYVCSCNYTLATLECFTFNFSLLGFNRYANITCALYLLHACSLLLLLGIIRIILNISRNYNFHCFFYVLFKTLNWQHRKCEILFYYWIFIYFLKCSKIHFQFPWERMQIISNNYFLYTSCLWRRNLNRFPTLFVQEILIISSIL